MPMKRHEDLAGQARHCREVSAGWMIQALGGRLGEVMKARLDRLGLTPDQMALLHALAEGDGISQVEIGRRVRRANYAVTRNLDALAARGLILRQPDEQSRRSHRVVLTEEGRTLMPVLFGVVSGVSTGLLAPLTREERTGLLELLAKLVAAHVPPQDAPDGHVPEESGP